MMNKIIKIKSFILLFVFLCTLSLSAAINSMKNTLPAAVEQQDFYIHEDLLTVQNTNSLRKARIKKRMQYIDKILEELNDILYSQEKSSTEVLQKIKRLLSELEKLQRDRDL